MEVHRQREEIQKLRRAGEFEQAEKLLAAARVYTDGVLALFNSLANLDQGLTEHAEAPGFVSANLKNWIDDEAKLVASKRRHHDS
jgi:hypothetical protein